MIDLIRQVYYCPNKINTEGIDELVPTSHENFTEDETILILDRLKQAQEGIDHTSSAVFSFVVIFTKVLILKKDPANLSSFSSGSSGQYICRTLIVL
jgi:hypothetical protein